MKEKEKVIACCMLGDFNAVKHEGERKSSHFDKGKADNFNDFVKKANLQEISFGVNRSIGSYYPWSS